MSEPRPEPAYAVGIDLGTTHCAVAFAPLTRPRVRGMAIPQLSAPGELVERELLPSFLYLAAPGELSERDRALPWGDGEWAVGEIARRLGEKVPGRMVASAKSWVCHGGVNRRAPILPWNAPDSEPHVSPFAAQVAYLEHLRRAWDHAHPEAPLAEQDVVVTVPASFDEGARELTTSAAQEAGLRAVRLLEEPQAAFYDWLGANADELAARLADARLILVVDVGGGTTDLTLLRVRQGDAAGEGPAIERIAVGGHLMLGGDNMDAALAMYALDKAGLARPEDASVWSALVQSARRVKERLLAADAPDSGVISYTARGSRLIGNTKSITVDRDEAQAVLLDGFLPRSGAAEVAQRAGRAGLTTLGLPYTSDAAIGRHICAFLRRHAEASADAGAVVEDGLPRPDLLLLNGGVFNAPAMVQRLSEVLAGWYGGAEIRRLEHTSLDTAVAHGAVRSILGRRGVGEVIGGGTARAYYIGIAGAQGEPQALCVAPRAMDDGAAVDVPDRVFDLLVDQAVSFPLLAYTGDRVDPPGALLSLDEHGDELELLAPLQTLLRDKKRATADGTVPVTLRASLSEGGALELSLVTVELPPRRWRLDFTLRAPETPAAADAATLDRASEALPEAISVLRRTLGDSDPASAKRLRAQLEKVLGPRGQWSAATCRGLWDALWPLAAECARSELHELSWLRVCGWTLRPGFGAPGDEARIEGLWTLRSAGLHFPTKANWAEWWITWRRVAPGLDAARQAEMFESVRPWLWPSGRPPPGPHAHGAVEMMQLLAALELLPAEDKRRAGELLWTRIKKLRSYWPLGRVGARVLLRGDAAAVVPPADAETWLRRLLELPWAEAEGAAFAAASIARATGQVEIDVDPVLREQVAARLHATGAPSTWIDMVTRPAELTAGDLTRAFGDSLPVGLRLT
jgi:hypothetical protein